MLISLLLNRILDVVCHLHIGGLLLWKAEIEKETLTIRFASPDILFDDNSAVLKPEFTKILDEFMPRYLTLLKLRFEKQVSEVRIEGHTSSGYYGQTGNSAFIENMALSQARTRSVLNYSLAIPELKKISNWIHKTVSANGLSSARIIYDASGKENSELSRRVEFSVRTKTREALKGVLEEISPSIENKI